MSFSFEDFLLYTKAPESDIKMFSAIAPGVLEYIKDTYGIYVLNEDIDYQYKLSTTGTTFTLPITPINTISKILFDGTEFQFTWYGDDIVMSTPTTDVRKPVICTLNVGYTIVPADLKLAIYQHIESIYFRTKNSIDNIEKVLNSTGSTTYFREDAIPKLSRSVYDKYSVRTIALY